MSEYNLHKSVANYIKMQYPNVVFNSDPSGIKLTIGQAVKMLKLKSNHKQLDVVILKSNMEYSGLVIELKEKSPFLKNGELSNLKHIQTQNETLKILNKQGYYSCFAWNFDMCKNIIDNYMSIPNK